MILFYHPAKKKQVCTIWFSAPRERLDERHDMDYNTLLDTAVDLGYELAMCGAETYRVEESITRVLRTYGIESEVFAIPNNLIVSIETPEGKPMTRMRRIGHHGNDLNSVELFSGLSRALCNRKPESKEARRWLAYVRNMKKFYSFPMQLVGNFLGAGGFGLFFGGTWPDAVLAGICGILVGIVSKFLDNVKTNQFFRTIAASFLMGLAAYGFGALGLTGNTDSMIIGTLMILVPGLLFTNAMRDIIYGDTNSGVNRIVQVLLIAAGLALGTAAAWNTAAALWGTPANALVLTHGAFVQILACFIGCLGFVILFNIHGPGGLLCALGGALTWVVYLLAMELGGTDLMANFWASLFAGAYSEVMARIRKYPAISYLVVSIFPLLPGAGVYYTMNYAVRGQTDLFAESLMHTAAIAGILAVGILMASTIMRLWNEWKKLRKA